MAASKQLFEPDNSDNTFITK